MLVNSLITSIRNGQRVPRGKPLEIRGVAWDGGAGIAKVEVSTAGTSWTPARPAQDLGRFSFREFSHSVATRDPGALGVMARAPSASGETQVSELIHNPAGYPH